jgi:hypothetical protein
MSKTEKWRIVQWLVCVAAAVLGVFLGVANDYPAVQFRCWLNLTECPVVDTVGAQAVGDHLAREIVEPSEFQIFYVRENTVIEEIAYVPGQALRVLPSQEEDAVLIFSNYPFSQLAFPWEAWDALPEGALHVHRFLDDEWTHVATAQTGRVPAGPPGASGYRIGWDCRWNVSDMTHVPGYQLMGYGLQISASGQLPEDVTIPIDFLPCVPTWDADNPEWEVVKVERLDACSNMGTAGWSGKMLQVWVSDEAGEPLGGIEVSFTSDHGEGMAWDRQNVGGWTSRFGLLEWDTWGVPTRYMFSMENDLETLAWNFRTDLHYEYCRGSSSGGWRPPNRPGWYSYAVYVQRKGKPQ